MTQNIDTGPDGDNDPARPIAALLPVAAILPALPQLPSVAGPPWKQRFEGLKTAPVTGYHLVYFSENNPLSQFFITADNQTPALFDPNVPPAITTTQGSVEDWLVENRTLENHEFHIHQIHFLLMERDGVPVPPEEQQFLDTIDVPYWSGSGPYPSVKVRMDFRGPDIGDFVFHCHILEHEDRGMMQIIRVLPAGVFNARLRQGEFQARRWPLAFSRGDFSTPEPRAPAFLVFGNDLPRGNFPPFTAHCGNVHTSQIRSADSHRMKSYSRDPPEWQVIILGGRHA